MQVAFLSNVVYPFVTGGAEKRIHEIGTRLADRGHDVTVYGRHFWDGPTEIVHEGVTHHAVAPEADLYDGERRSISEAIDFAARALPTLRRRATDHDVLDASLFPYFPVFAARLATLRTDTPLVTTWHEVWLGHWDEYLGRLAPAGKAIERLTAKTPHHPVAVSELTADRLACIGPRRDNIDVVPNGIDVDRVRTVPEADPGFDVLYAGRLVEHKNVDLLLEAFDRAATADHTLGIVGDGPERDRLERHATTLDAADRITFTGFLDEYEAVLGHMRAADVFASPSTREGFGITFLEAMAADCTVIGADHPESAAGEVIGDAGLLVEPTADALADALETALRGTPPAADPLDRARKYDWDRIADRSLDVYRSAVRD